MTYHATPTIHIYIDTPTPIFKARLDMPTVTYPVTALTFDGVTLGAYTDVQADMTLLLGSADGLDDYGRVRVQNILTSTTIPVGRISRGLEDGQLTITDNAYITILEDYRVWSKLPYEALTDPPTAHKDSDVLVEAGGQNYNIEIPPVANCGPGFAGYIDSVTGKLRVAFDGSLSFTMAEGATITTWGWAIPGSATIISGALDESALTVDFEPGFYWVQLSVTDSNGKGHSARCPVLAVDPANDVTLQQAAIESQRFTLSGQTLTLRLYGDMPRTTYPDGALVLVWYDAPSSPADRSHMKFIGWHQSDSWGMRSTPRGLVRDTLLTCLDVAGRLDTLPGFPQALERNDEEALWSYMPGLHISRALHYLLHWHSTALVVADFFLPATGDDYPAMRLDSTGATLFDQTNSRALSMVPDHYLTCNAQGQMAVLEDWMLVDEGSRPAASVILTEDDVAEIRADYTRPPKVYALRSGAVVCSTDWEYDAFGEPTLPLAFSVAPHTDAGAFGQGANEAITGEKLTISQTALNTCEGHRYARLNSRDGLYQITPAHPDDVWDLIPALLARVQLNVGALYAAQRGLSWTQTNGQIKELTLRYQVTREGIALAPTLTFERETAGVPAITYTPPESGEPDYESETPPVPTVPPPTLSDGQEQVVGIDINGNIYRTGDFQTPSGSGGPTWSEVSTGITETIYSWVVDPFSAGYAPGATSGSIDGWVATEDAIYKLSNLFGTLTVDEVYTFATQATAASFHWRTIQASFGGFFAEGVNPWLLCVSYYGDSAGHTGTWATHSLDGGITWSTEVQISAYSVSGTPTRFNPIAVYASPRTPGLCYTVAYSSAGGGGADVQWALYDGTLPPTDLGISGSQSVVNLVEDLDGGAATSLDKFLWLCPPANTKRVKVSGSWISDFYSPSGGNCGSNIDVLDSIFTTLTDDLVHTVPGGGDTATTSGSYEAECTFPGFATGDWPVNSTNYASQSNSGLRFRCYSAVSPFGSNPVRSTTTHSVTVLEVELDDGTILTPAEALTDGYVSTDWGETWTRVNGVPIQPGQAFGGTIHVPWPTNEDEGLVYHGYYEDTGDIRRFRLYKSDGGVTTDISPFDSSIGYGVNRGPFGVRTYDSDRDYMLLAGMGNETSNDPADDLHGIFSSIDAGATWSVAVTPEADSGAPAGRPMFEAAFSGTNPLVHFYWGKPEWIAYSDDGGVSVDSRVGNLSGFTASGFIGIAGGIS